MTETAFPIDWNDWKAEWEDWKARHANDLKATDYRIPGRNVLADDVLGTWNINGRDVELSEVVFPSFERDDATGRLKGDDIRYIGLSFPIGVEAELVRSFSELERVLGIK